MELKVISLKNKYKVVYVKIQTFENGVPVIYWVADSVDGYELFSPLT